MSDAPHLVNGKPWAERWADILAGAGCVCGQRHDTNHQGAPDDGHKEAHPRG